MSIVFGLVLIATNYVGFMIVKYADRKRFGLGFGCGLSLVLGGSFTIVAGKKKSRCLVKTSLVMSILVSISVGLLLIFALRTCLQDLNRYRDYETDIYHYYKQLVTDEPTTRPTTQPTTTLWWGYNVGRAYNYDVQYLKYPKYSKGWLTKTQEKMADQKRAVTISSIIIGCCLVASIPAIWSAFLPCKVTCCKTDMEETVVEWWPVRNIPGSESMPLQPGADGGACLQLE